MTVSSSRARELVGRFRDQRVLVVGDLMLDRYVYGSVSRISPEAPVPVVHVTREKSAAGGAGNVAWNIQSLGGSSNVCGVLGQDAAAEELTSLLTANGVSVGHILRDPAMQTAVKTRVIAERQQVVRVDRERTDVVPDAVMHQFHERVASAIGDDTTAVILEDYGKGAIGQGVVDVVLEAARKKEIPVGFDPKENHELRVAGATLATPNRHEAFAAVGLRDTTNQVDPLRDDCLKQVARALFAAWQSELLLITLGSQGMLLAKDGDPTLHVPTRAREVFDVSGAGDTVIATSVLALAAGATPEEAAELANYAAGVVVGKLGTADCSPDELLAYVER